MFDHTLFKHLFPSRTHYRQVYSASFSYSLVLPKLWVTESDIFAYVSAVYTGRGIYTEDEVLFLWQSTVKNKVRA
jgi:hypothetical protein